jgi:hypothetical protein
VAPESDAVGAVLFIAEVLAAYGLRMLCAAAGEQ